MGKNKNKPIYRVEFKHDRLGVAMVYCWVFDYYTLPLVQLEEIEQNHSVISKYLRPDEAVRFTNFNAVGKITFPYFSLINSLELFPYPNNNIKAVRNQPDVRHQ